MSLLEREGIHPQHAIGGAAMQMTGGALIAAGAAGDEKRQQMFFAGMLDGGIGRLAAIGDEVAIARLQQSLGHPVSESIDIGARRGIDRLAAETRKIMGEGAGSDDQDILPAQWLERAADLQVMCRP